MIPSFGLSATAIRCSATASFRRSNLQHAFASTKCTCAFLGSAAANTQAPPETFQGEFAELIRAYKSSFIYWLQTKSKGGEKASREKFAALLKKLADPNLQSDFEAVFKDVYDGAPLSAPDADKTSLEGQFLIWLSKQK